MHTLWMREHNRWCDVLLSRHPDWTGQEERIWQEARRRVMALQQHVTVNEFLPALLRSHWISPTVYEEGVDASI